MDEVSAATQSFTANVVVVAEWRDERLAGDLDQRQVKLSDIWDPMIQIVNQQRLLKTFPEVARVSSDGTVRTIQRYWGKFSNPLELHDFPLDRHTFAIQFIAAADPENTEIVVLDDGKSQSGMAEKLSLPDWGVTGWKMTAGTVELVPGMPLLPGARFEFNAGRYLGYYLVKVMLPLLMIVMMSWIVFWIHPSESGSQISVSVTSMLTLIAYRFALGSTLPHVSYITRMDGFILVATILVFFALLEAVLTSRLVKIGKEELALKFDRVCRVLFPAVFLVVGLYAAFG